MQRTFSKSLKVNSLKNEGGERILMIFFNSIKSTLKMFNPISLYIYIYLLNSLAQR